MTYNNTFNVSKNYEAVRFQYGQKPVSQEFNELQSILHNQVFQAFNVLFDEGFVYLGCELISGSETSLSLSSGFVQLDGFARSVPATTFDITTAGTDVPIWAQLVYTDVTSTEDTALQHPAQPDLPVGHRQKASISLSIIDPGTLTNPPAFISRVYFKIFNYNKTTKVLSKLVDNSSKFFNLKNIPGQLQPGQIGPGAVDTSSIAVIVDGLPIREALAIRTDDAEGSFLANGGAVIYDSNGASGMKVRLEAFRAYVNGFQVRFDRDQIYTLSPTNVTKTRSNESKTYTTGTLTYALSKSPAAALTALDGDVTVTSENVTRGSGNFDNVANTPLVDITNVVQGMTTYVKNTDYQVSGDQIQWISGTRPAQGTTYQVTYKYRRAFVIPTDVDLAADKKSITFTGTVLPVNSSTFQATYTYYVPRVDIIGVDQNGAVSIYAGTPNDTATPPVVPNGIFLLAQVTIPAGSHLGNTFLSNNGYTVPSGASINYRTVQVAASRMRDHQRRYQNLQDLAFNSTVDTVASYFTTKDPTLAKLGTFADGFYDDRLSDYGQTSQNMVFNSESQQGEGARTPIIQPLEVTDPNVSPTGFKYHTGSFASLNYTEKVAIEQTKWSSITDLQPYSISPATRKIEVPNRNLVVGQTFTIRGHNWDYGEDQIQFFINGQLLTGITIVTGTAGSASNSVTPTTDRRFEVKFTVPTGLPIGYRIIKAISAVTLNEVEVLVGIQTASVPLPSVDYNTINYVPVASTIERPCGAIRFVAIGRRNWLIYQFNCDINDWVVIGRADPVIQTFTSNESFFLTAVDVWFTAKDPTASVLASVVLTRDGEPDVAAGRLGATIVQPSAVLTNGNPTKITFDNPVFIQAGQEYGIFFECPTTGFQVQYAKLGQLDKSSYTSGVGQYREFNSATSNAKGPFTAVINLNKRDRDTTYRWTEKAMTFTPAENTTIYQINAKVYIGSDTTNFTPILGVDLSNDRFETSTAHGLVTGDKTQFTSTIRLPAPIQANTTYYVNVFNTTKYTLHTTLSDAMAGTNRINLTDAGAGVTRMNSAKAARAIWQLKDATTNTILWTDNRVLQYNLNNPNSTFTGNWVAKGFENLYSFDAGNIIPAPISLVAGHQYELKVTADQSYEYQFLRDDYQDDGVLNAKLVGFTQTNVQYQKINQNALTTGLLFFSPDGTYWTGDPASDLRFRIYKADFSANTTATFTFKPFSTVAAAGKVTLSDSFTHFTSLLNSVTPPNTNITMDYSVDNGVTWIAHSPIVFKMLEFDDDTDRETWAFFNFGFFSKQRFSENQVDTQFVPSNPNKSVVMSALTTDIQFRLTLSTTNTNLSPLIDMTNWAIRFEKYGTSTIYFSRTIELQSDAVNTGGSTPARIYVWAILPSGVTQAVALTLDGDATTPTYVSKSSPTSTRVIDSATSLTEYQYDFVQADLSAQAERRHPKVRVTWTTSNRFAQPTVKRVGFNVF